MARVFISYRRDDSSGYAGRLYDRLSQHFGRDNLFMDVNSIPLGLDFVDVIQHAVGSCDVLLAVIGRQWLTSTDAQGSRRLDNPEDFVRLEILAALERRIRVIPVLVGGAVMPRSTELPDVLQSFARRNALMVGDHFHPDVNRLIEALETVPGTPSPPRVSAPAPPPILETPLRPSRSEAPPLTAATLAPSFTNSIGIEFILIRAGTFMMGSPDSDSEAYADEKPDHRVTISQPFYLGKYPVTQGQWVTVMGNNPSHFEGNLNRPVERVAWEDVQAFLRTLTAREGGKDYHLPSEAQWEYACRAGTDASRYHPDVNAIAWYQENSNAHPQPVGQKLPNAWGLYDMLGNVWEWCRDGRREYTAEVIIDPMGPTGAGAHRVIRGGSWFVSAQVVRAAYRRWYVPGNRHGNLGFRCASSGPST